MQEPQREDPIAEVGARGTEWVGMWWVRWQTRPAVLSSAQLSGGSWGRRGQDPFPSGTRKSSWCPSVLGIPCPSLQGLGKPGPFSPSYSRVLGLPPARFPGQNPTPLCPVPPYLVPPVFEANLFPGAPVGQNGSFGARAAGTGAGMHLWPGQVGLRWQPERGPEHTPGSGLEAGFWARGRLGEGPQGGRTRALGRARFLHLRQDHSQTPGACLAPLSCPGRRPWDTRGLQGGQGPGQCSPAAPWRPRGPHPIASRQRVGEAEP